MTLTLHYSKFLRNILFLLQLFFLGLDQELRFLEVLVILLIFCKLLLIHLIYNGIKLMLI